MCGFAVCLDADAGSSAEVLGSTATRMADRMRHRGPDDAGVWVDARAGIALSHRRLAIVDLSPEGHQPMTSADGRYVVTFNGEIYNHGALREELVDRGHGFRGHSDTEVLLAAVSEWGLDEALARFNGMFAFALWDARQRILHLARDRMGEKPLYYGWFGRTFLAASELKALRAHPAFDPELSRSALATYLRHGYVPAPHSIYRNAFKLRPGSVVAISAREPGAGTARAYWTVEDAAARGLENPYSGPVDGAVDALEEALREAVRLRMHADVPLGAFLSGGIDSTTVVALMQAQSMRPVQTFSIGFFESGFNEAEAAKGVAEHLGTDHTELYLTAEQALNVVPHLPTLYDEPFADSSQIPTFLVSRLARTRVTVSLSGDGGDELFCGYGRYLIARSIWSWLRPTPRPIKWAAALLAAHLPARLERAVLRTTSALLARDVAVKPTPGRLRRISRLLSAETFEALYSDLVSAWPDPRAVVPGATEASSSLVQAQAARTTRPLLERMMLWDCSSYLPDDILVKVDRASMGVSLEARVPMLDHHLVELAWRMPLDLKLRGGVTKWILRQVLHRYVPQHLIERPKQGFGIPIAAWLRGPLRDWAGTLLSERRLREQGLLNPKAVTSAFSAHLAGSGSREGELWTALMFQAWLDAAGNQDRPSAAPLVRAGASA